MRRIILSLLLLPGLLLAGAVISPLLQLQIEAAGPDDLLGVWAFFPDRGFGDEAELRSALDAFVAAMPAAQFERRALLREAPGLADERDLPVHRPYIEALRPLVSRYIGESRVANAACLELTVEQLHAVAALDHVVRLQPVAHCYLPPLEAPPAPGPVSTSHDYGHAEDQLTQIQVDRLHDAGYNGAGVVVLILDTGFRTDHEAFAEVELIAQYDFVNDDDNVDNEPGDHPNSWNHGTYIWGAIGGFVPGNLIGPAYAAGYLLAKTEDITQEVHDEEYWYEQGLRWGEELGAQVASSSLGYRLFDDGQDGYTYEDMDGETTIVARAVNWARDNGILVATAMGNSGTDGYGSLVSPADCDGILSVGAVNSDGNLAWFSSRGPTYDGRTKPEVCARGVDTYTSHADGPASYTYVSGTSLSTPLVGGVLACLRQAFPTAGVAEIRQALLETATRSHDPDNDYGWGIVRAGDALELLYPDAPVWSGLSAERTEAGALIRWGFSPDDEATAFNVYRLDERPVGASYAAAHLLTVSDPSSPPGLNPGEESWRRLNDHPLSHAATAWLDTSPPVEGCVYRVEAIDAQSRSHLSTELRLDQRAEERTQTRLEACFPNPARGALTFSFSLAESAPARLDVYDLAGRRVAVVVDAVLAAGRYEIAWDGRSADGAPLQSGVYFYSLQTPGYRESRRLVLLR